MYRRTLVYQCLNNEAISIYNSLFLSFVIFFFASEIFLSLSNLNIQTFRKLQHKLYNSSIMNENIKISDSIPLTPKPALLIFGYVSQLIVYGLILAHCILSPSLFSAIGLAYMLASFAVIVATPYYIQKRSVQSNRYKVYAYPVQTIVSGIFLIINIGAFVFKITIFAMNSQQNYSTSLQQFLQVQSALNMFLPLILIPFIFGSMMIRTKSRDIQQFSEKINALITIPIFLAMGILVLCLQIFSISVTGFLFFICMGALYVQRKIDFNNKSSWILVLVTQIFCGFLIVANFITTTEYLENFEDSAHYQFYGINGLNDFLSSETQRGYIICLIILFIVLSLIQRIFSYNAIWLIVATVLNLGQINQSNIFMEQGVVIDSAANRDTQRDQIDRRASSYSLVEFELPSVDKSKQISSLKKKRHNTEENFKSSLEQPLLLQKKPSYQDDILRNSIESQKNEADKNKKKSKSLGKKIADYFLIGINKFVDFIYSTQFSLRFTQVMSIVVIQRYNNIYSFVALLWLSIVASTARLRLIFYITMFVLLPVELGNYIILYFYNIPENPIQSLQNLQIFGFQKMQLFWLDVIIFNVYFFYLVTFLLAASKDRAQNFFSRSSKVPPPSWYIFITALFFRYSYLLTIAAMFFIGFSNVELIHLVYVVLFLIFFTSGENVLIQKKKRNNKQVATLTTFSRKYWFIIVYFTLICIILKYIYFLFFPGKLVEILQPTGISQTYNWSFNFSLSSICLSNTTPLFIVFVLSESQILIYKSSIYLNYSFSLMTQIIQLRKPRNNSFRVFLNKIAETFLQFYYQSLYYISGVIILLCCYKWNILGLCIIIVTCIGLVRGFHRVTWATIVFLDLVYIILNYLALFITYQITQQVIGQSAVQIVRKISYFIGFQIIQNSNLSQIFILNILIFYLASQSYSLTKIIEEDRFDTETILQNQIEGDQTKKKQKQDTISSYQKTILDQQLNDLQFAKNFNKNIILATKRLYATNLWKKHSWWFKICRIFSIFFIDGTTIFVLVCCLNFRLSVSMFYFLLFYLIYYFVLFDNVGKLMQQSEFYGRIQRQFITFKKKEPIICERENPRGIITGQQSTQSLSQFIDQIRQSSIKLRFQWRYSLWYFVSILTVICLVLTYTSQFIYSQFYTTYLNFSWTISMQNILFVFGVSYTDQTSLFRQIYFYYFMMYIVVVEKLIVKFNKDVTEYEKNESKPTTLSKQEYKQMENTINFIDQSLDFIEEVQIRGPVESHHSYSISSDYFRKKQQEKQQLDQFSKEANLLIYFEYRGALIKINCLYGGLMFLLRFYLLMMLINLYSKSNIFAIAYLFSVLYFWFQKLQFSMVRNINKIAIIILLLQYLALLLDITPDTSSLPLPLEPYNSNLSILNIIFPNGSRWISYLVVDFKKQTIGSYTLSFFISSIIIFLTQIYFTMFFWISTNSVKMMKEIYKRYQYIQETLQRMPQGDTIFLNYDNYKSWSYRFMVLTYQLLINNSYIFIAYLILILLSGIHNYIALGLVGFACIYIYIGIFTGFSEDKNIYIYTRLFFKIVQGILFLILITITFAEIPVFPQDNKIVTEIQSLTNITQIFLMFLIQIWLDLSYSVQFKQATEQYNNRVKNREDVLIKCIAYQENKDLVQRMIRRYKQALWFQVNLKDALDIISQWHKVMYQKTYTQFDNLKKTKSSPQIQLLQQQIRKQQQRRPEEDERFVVRAEQYMLEKTSIALNSGYYEIMKFIVFSNHRLINTQHTSVDIWDYVLENFEKLNQIIKQSQKNLSNLTKVVVEEQFGYRMERIQSLKKQQYSSEQDNLNTKVMGIIKTPNMIFIDIKPAKKTFSTVFFHFLMSNFPYVLSFFIWIYYMINPCFLSLPFIVYFFAFEIISNVKLTPIMLIYIFTIVLFALFLQIYNPQFVWIKYLFFQEQDANGNIETSYAIGYLFFIFILIFINQQLRKYQGNKFKHPHEAQNKYQGVLRILINEDNTSKMNLWSFRMNEEDEEKQYNPYQFFSQQLQAQPQLLVDCPIPGFFAGINEGKTGIDLYPFIATIQIFLTIYLIFFYPLMTSSNSTTIQQTIKYYQFSSEMVLAVLAQVITIIVERKITLIRFENKKKSLIKYIYTMTIFFLFLIFIYYIAPVNKQVRGIYYPTGFLVGFSFFYFIYFFLSAIQIRLGYKKYKSLNSMLTKRRQFNSILASMFTGVPFLYQLKVMMDYSFCQTSLQLNDWFRLFTIYLSAFRAKLNYYFATGNILGNPQPWPGKIIAWAGFILILVIIFGPMILFSGLNPIAQANLVVSGALQLGIQIQGGNFFELYSTSHFQTPPLTFTPELFNAQGFDQIPALQILSTNDISQQFQQIQFQPYADSNWGISIPNYQFLLEKMNQTIYQLNNSLPPSSNFTINVKYVLQRKITETESTDTNFQYPLNTSQSLNQTILEDLYSTLTQCNTPTFLPQFYISLIRLFTTGKTYKPRPIIYTNSTGVDPYLQGSYLTLLCDSPNETIQTNSVYWALISTNTSSENPYEPTQNGVFFYILCDKYQNVIGGLGFTALYTSVILVVAGFIRGMFQSNIPQLTYILNPKPDNIIQISQAIGTLRDRKQYRQQYLMYYELIDIIRSPDLMKFLSGSYPVAIQEADNKRKKKQQDKEDEQRKTKVE